MLGSQGATFPQKVRAHGGTGERYLYKHFDTVHVHVFHLHSCRRISTQCPPVNNTEHRVCNTFAIRQYSARLLMHINDSSNLTSVRGGGANTVEILCGYIFWCKSLLMMTSVSQCPRSNAILLAMISAANTVERVRTQQY